jgi:octopine/nopaline transport system permease protein
MEVFLCAALIYLVLNFLIVRAMAWVEYQLSPHLRERPTQRAAEPVPETPSSL